MKSKRFLKHFDKVVVFVTAIIVLILDILGVTTSATVYQVILAVLAIQILFLIKLENQIEKLSYIDDIEGIRAFRLSRESLPTILDTFALASTELILWGSSLMSISYKSSMIIQKLNQGCRIKILLMAETDAAGNSNGNISKYQEIIKQVGFQKRLSLAHEELKVLGGLLNETQKSLLEIRQYTFFPTANYVIIDKDSKRGIIRVEPSLFGFFNDQSPSFDIDARSGAKLFELICKSFEEAWSNSRPLI